MTISESDDVQARVKDKTQNLPDLEEKLESANTRITYLVKKVSQLSRAQAGSSAVSISNERLRSLAQKLRNQGLAIEYTDGRGFIKLKALDQRGIDTLKRLNTLFPISQIESYLDNYL